MRPAAGSPRSSRSGRRARAGRPGRRAARCSRAARAPRPRTAGGRPSCAPKGPRRSGLRSTRMIAKRSSSAGSQAGSSRLMRGSFSTSGAASRPRPQGCPAPRRPWAATPACVPPRRCAQAACPSCRRARSRRSSFRAFTSARSKNPFGLSSAAGSRSASSPAKKPALARKPATALVPLRCMPSMATPPLPRPPGLPSASGCPRDLSRH